MFLLWWRWVLPCLPPLLFARSWRRCCQNRPVMRCRLQLEQAHVALAFSSDGALLEAGGFALDAASEPGASQSTESASDEAGWSFDVRSVELTNVALTVQPWQHDVELARLRVQTDGLIRATRDRRCADA